MVYTIIISFILTTNNNICLGSKELLNNHEIYISGDLGSVKVWNGRYEKNIFGTFSLLQYDRNDNKAYIKDLLNQNDIPLTVSYSCIKPKFSIHGTFQGYWGTLKVGSRT